MTERALRVYLGPPPGLSRAMDRVARALAQHAPAGAVEIVPDPGRADVVVLHVIGYPETERVIKDLAGTGTKYVIIQYCLRTTQRPSTLDWLPLWRGAALVWSYYDLQALYQEDAGGEHTLAAEGIHRYESPLGVDPAFKRWASVPRKYTILTSGYVAESEGVREAAEAVRAFGGRQYHLGPDLKLGDRAVHRLGLSDEVLAQVYSGCCYVAGLRRTEGFELPAAEGLVCGARPVCFDRPHYRRWFGNFAEYVPEGTFEEVCDALEQLFRGPYRDVTDTEIAAAKETFSWQRIAYGFWSSLLESPALAPPLAQPGARGPLGASRSTSQGSKLEPMGYPTLPEGRASSAIEVVSKRRRLLWCGDAGVSTGFALSTHKVLETVAREYDVSVLALNYNGDPHDFPYRLYPAGASQGDAFGLRRIPELVRKLGPDLLVVQNDPWNIPAYLKAAGNVPAVGVVAVDGLNCAGRGLNGLRHAIFWTKFGETQAKNGGYAGPSSVVPLGVDLGVFRVLPESKAELRRRAGLPERTWDAFIVGNVNRNQPRKRLDLVVAHFARWVKEYQVPDAYLYLHVAPTGDRGWNLQQLAEFYGINNRLILAEPPIGLGAPEEMLVQTYNMMDLGFSMTQGEGFGLTTLEGMACGVPQVAPDWAALGEWARDAAALIACSDTAATPNNINVIGGIADPELAVGVLHKLYTDGQYLERLQQRGLELARRPEYRWDRIGQEVLAAFQSVTDAVPALVEVAR